MTTRGFKEKEFIELVNIMDFVLKDPDNAKVKAEAKAKIAALMKNFPL